MPIGAMIGATAIKAGTSLLGGLIASRGARKASEAATTASREALATARGDLAPFTLTGRGALTSLADLYGLPSPERPEGGEPYPASALETFRRSPDYQFPLTEGLRAIEASRASRGLLGSGGTAKELQEYGSGLASGNFGNYVSRLLQLAGMGQGAATGSAEAALSTGRDIAESRAGGILGPARAWNEALGGVGSAFTGLGTNLADYSLAKRYGLMNPPGSSYFNDRYRIGSLRPGW